MKFIPLAVCALALSGLTGCAAEQTASPQRWVKVCSGVNGGANRWRDSIAVPEGFTRDDCKEFAKGIAATNVQLVCTGAGGQYTYGPELGRDTSATPLPPDKNFCGW